MYHPIMITPTTKILRVPGKPLSMMETPNVHPMSPVEKPESSDCSKMLSSKQHKYPRKSRNIESLRLMAVLAALCFLEASACRYGPCSDGNRIRCRLLRETENHTRRCSRRRLPVGDSDDSAPPVLRLGWLPTKIVLQ